MSEPKLVIVEWEDSAQPLPGWRWFSEFEDYSVNLCRSVGWLVHGDRDVTALAANVSGMDADDSLQMSGLIRIPTRSIRRIEPISSSLASDPSARPD